MRGRFLLALLSVVCLRAQPMPAGIDPGAILEDEAERDTREKIADIASALGLREGSIVADIGAGYGYYALRFSKVVGATGRVLAQEIDRPLLDKLRLRLETAGLKNVEPVLGTGGDPCLPEECCDAILIADVYHEIQNPLPFLKKLKTALKPGGRLMVIDYLKPELKSEPREDQLPAHNIAPEYIAADLKAAGLRVTERRDPLGQGYDKVPTYYILAVRP